MAHLPLLLALLLGFAAAEANAHATLRAVSPPDGSALDAAPAELLLQFSEPVAPLSVRLETTEGGALELVLEPSGDGSGLRLRPVAPLPHGSYLLRWRVVSADGHPVAGRSAFAIGDRSLAAGSEEPVGSATLIVTRTIHLGTTLVGAGGTLAMLLLPLGASSARATAGWVRAALVTSLVAALGKAAVTGLEATGQGVETLLGGEPWGALIVTGTLPALATTAAGTLLLLVAGPRSCGRPAPPVTYPGILLVALGFALTGHTATAPPLAVFAPLLVVHVVLALFWLGALLPLALSLQLDPAATSRAVLARFAAYALVLVPALLLVGTVLAMRQMREGGLLSTTWGRILLVKLALLAGLLAVAAVNRTRLLPRFAGGDAGAGRAMLRLLTLDGMLAAGLLMATATLASTPPPRLLAALQPDGRELLLEEGSVAARVRIDPGVAGWTRLEVRVLDRPPPEEVRVRLQPPAPESEPIDTLARPDGTGAYRTEPLLLVPGGTWQLAVGILLDPFTWVELAAEIELR